MDNACYRWSTGSNARAYAPARTQAPTGARVSKEGLALSGVAFRSVPASKSLALPKIPGTLALWISVVSSAYGPVVLWLRLWPYGPMVGVTGCDFKV